MREHLFKIMCSFKKVLHVLYQIFYTLTIYKFILTVGGGDVDGVDDIHLILEYKTGEKWGTYEAPRANR